MYKNFIMFFFLCSINAFASDEYLFKYERRFEGMSDGQYSSPNTIEVDYVLDVHQKWMPTRGYSIELLSSVDRKNSNNFKKWITHINLDPIIFYKDEKLSELSTFRFKNNILMNNETRVCDIEKYIENEFKMYKGGWSWGLHEGYCKEASIYLWTYKNKKPYYEHTLAIILEDIKNKVGKFKIGGETVYANFSKLKNIQIKEPAYLRVQKIVGKDVYDEAQRILYEIVDTRDIFKAMEVCRKHSLFCKKRIPKGEPHETSHRSSDVYNLFLFPAYGCHVGYYKEGKIINETLYKYIKKLFTLKNYIYTGILDNPSNLNPFYFDFARDDPYNSGISFYKDNKSKKSKRYVLDDVYLNYQNFLEQIHELEFGKNKLLNKPCEDEDWPLEFRTYKGQDMGKRIFDIKDRDYILNYIRNQK